MDADLEAILAESDSDDGIGGEGGGLRLEDILKEDNEQASPLQEYRAPQTNEDDHSRCFLTATAQTGVREFANKSTASAASLDCVKLQSHDRVGCRCSLPEKDCMH